MKKLKISFEEVPSEQNNTNKTVRIVISSIIIIILLASAVFGVVLYNECSASPRVYITDTGEKYHRSNCYYLRDSKKEISLKWAEIKGYTPCKGCKP